MLVGANGVPLAVREFQLKGGGFVISELLEYNEAARWYRYRILKTNLPMKGYEAEMHVEAAAGGGSIVVWSGQFQRPEETAKPDQDDAATMKLVQGVFRSGWRIWKRSPSTEAYVAMLARPRMIRCASSSPPS
jgi:Polyketide cyclase / dehydrase and lipid transport